MLKVTAPIQLNIKPQIVGAGEGFCKRMTANYDMIDATPPTESLLHVTTEPPEYYFGQDSTNYINNTTNVNITEQTNAQIVNNLVNRIMVEPSFGLLYQDRIYISNALRKLGIRDEKTFMNQVYAMKEEISHTNELINMYFNYGTDIRNLISEYSKSEQTENTEINTANEQELHLHEDIFNRLNTALIYSIVDNYHTDAYGMDVISTNEMLIAEQRRAYENILLRELQSDVRGEKVPLVYKVENYFEEYDFNEENSNDKKITEVINSASLLSFINNAYETKNLKENNNVNIWYEVRPTVQNSTQNSLVRLESHIRNEGASKALNITNQQLNNLVMQNEIEILSRIIEESPNVENITELSLNYNNTESQITENEIVDLTEELNQQNIKNIENMTLYQETIKTERESVQKKLSEKERRDRQRRDSLEALSSPEELIMTLRNEQAVHDENEQRIAETAAQITLNSEEQIINLINQYMENPNISIPGAMITRDDFGTLMSDIELVNRSQQNLDITEVENNETIEKIVNEVSKEIVEDVTTPSVNRRIKESIQNMDLVHRTTENTSFEDVTEQLMEQNRWLYEHTKQTDEVILNRNVENVNVTNENVIDMEAINRNINEVVNDTVTQSMNLFSDQIYKKIENKLQTEKRRRGL